MSSRLTPEETAVAVRLKRAVGRAHGAFQMCYLVSNDEEQRSRIAAELARTLDADERVSLAAVSERSTEGLVTALQGTGKPVQVTEPEGWPGGIEDTGRMLRGARDRLGAECRRPILIWTSEADLGAMLKAGEDLHSWNSGIFDFTTTD